MVDDEKRAVAGFDRPGLVIVVIAIVIAAVSSRPYAGSWNDGSRLAAIESLVDYHTWAIDQSIFAGAPAADNNPYPTTDPALRKFGTRDKMWIGGHFYSDKPPVLTLILAAAYRSVQLVTGLRAREHPGWFCYLLTLFSSGLAYVVSVHCIDRLAVSHGLRRSARMLVVLAFSLGTIALPYARHVNNHIILLAVCCAVIVLICRRQILSNIQLARLGVLLGVAYTLDVAIGAVLVCGILALTISHWKTWTAPMLLLAAAFPLFALHHALNYRISGTLLPANTHPEFFQWPGSPFNAESLTGSWHHPSVFAFMGYAMDLLAGHRGFVWHDLPVLVAVPGSIWLLRQNVLQKDRIWFAIGLSAFSWLAYAIASNNHGGLCCSVRWFVPLLAPDFYLVVRLLHSRPLAERELQILTAGGLLLGPLMWWQGPWNSKLVPGFWVVVTATLVTWLVYRARATRPARIPAASYL